MTATARARGSSGGFTLLEVVVVLVVLAVAGALAVPSFRPPPAETALDEGAGRVAALFRMARTEAVRQGVAVQVVLDSASARAWVDVRDSAEAESLELPAGVTLHLPEARVLYRFDPGGGTNGGGVVVRGPGGGERFVHLDRWSGHVSIH
jgi:general secretion pathway protein H